MKEPFGPLESPDREVGPGGVADEEGVSGEDEPRLAAARVVDDGEAAVLGPVAGGVDDAQADGPDPDLLSVAHRVVRIVDARFGVHADGDPVLECEPTVSGDVVGVCVRLDRPDDPHPAPLGLLQDRLDRERRVDDCRDRGVFVTHEITRTAQIVVQELVEDHDPTVAPGPAIDLEVNFGAEGARRRGCRRSRWFPTQAAMTALQRCCFGAAAPVAGSTLRSDSPADRSAVVVRLDRGERVGPGADPRHDAHGNDIVVPSSMRPPDHVTVDPSPLACQPAGAIADTTEIPGGAVTRTATVVWGGRSFGATNVISVSTPSSTNGGAAITCARAATGRARAIATTASARLTASRGGGR